jgi:hypothetical protein
MKPASANRGGRLLVLLWVCCLAPAVPRPAAARARLPEKTLARLDPTTQWRHLVVLWQAMLDHADRTVYNPEAFRALSADLQAGSKDLAALAKAGLLSAEIAGDLDSLFQDRYAYLASQHYTAERNISLGPEEAATSAARWVVEMELSLLRRSAQEPETDPKLAEAAASNLTFELTFLYHCRRFEEEAQRRRRDLQTQQASGKQVDWPSFDGDYQRRLQSLLEAYRRRSLSPAKPVQRMMPYVLALTETRPEKGTPEAEPSAGPR